MRLQQRVHHLPSTRSAAAARIRQLLSAVRKKRRKCCLAVLYLLFFAAALNRDLGLGELSSGASWSGAVAKPKEPGAVVFLAGQRNAVDFGMDRFCMLMRAIRSVDQHLNSHYGPYPIYVLVAKDHALDDQQLDAAYTESDRSLIRSWAPHSTIHFVEINLYSGDALEPNTTREQILEWRSGADGAVAGRDIGYQSMCRLWSGRLQNMGFLDRHEYYMRMDDDSLLLKALPDDPFRTMQERNLTYAYRRDKFDHWGRWKLWITAKPHLDLSGKKLPYLHGNNEDDFEYKGDQPYNNFHVTAVAFWRSPRWMRLWKDMNDNHLFFKYRVGDANVHAFAVMMMADRNWEYQNWERWDSFPYAHNTNDMRRWGKDKGWAAECKAAQDAGTEPSNTTSLSF